MTLISPSQFATLRSLFAAGASLADIALRLELDVDSVSEWTAVIDGPGPFDVSVRAEGGSVTVEAGPAELTLEGHDAELRIDVPGNRDVVLEHTDGELRGPRLEAPNRQDPMEFFARAVSDVELERVSPHLVALLADVRALRQSVRAGELDDDLADLAALEQAGRRRGRVLRPIRRRARALLTPQEG